MIYGLIYKCNRELIEQNSHTIHFADTINEDNHTISLNNGKNSLAIWFSTQPHGGVRFKAAETVDDIKNGNYEEVYYDTDIMYKHKGSKDGVSYPDTKDTKLNKNIHSVAIRYEQPLRLLQQDKDFTVKTLDNLVSCDFARLQNKKIKKMSGKVEVTKNRKGEYEMHEV